MTRKPSLFPIALGIGILIVGTVFAFIFLRDDSSIFLRVEGESNKINAIRIGDGEFYPLNGNSFFPFDYPIGIDVIIEVAQHKNGYRDLKVVGNCTVQKIHRNCIAELLFFEGKLRCSNCVLD